MKKFLLGSMLAIFGFASVYAIIQPDIRGWSTIVNPNPDNYFTIIQSGTTQGKISIANFINAVSGSLNYVPRSSWNGGKNIEFTDDGAIEVVNIGRDNPFDNSLALTYAGDEVNTDNNQTQIRIGGYDDPRMYYMFTSGGLNKIIEYTWDKVRSNLIYEYTDDYSASYTDRSLVDKGYTDTKVPRTAIDTGFNNKTSDTIIPSEKTVWSLVTGLTNTYVPFWDGSKFINSSIYKTINFLSLSNVSTGALFNIYSDFIYASTNIVDWKITENRFKIGTPDGGTTGVYIEGKMGDGIIDIYTDTGVNIKSKYFSAISGLSIGIYSVAMGRNATATGENGVALGYFARAYGDDSIALGSISTAYHNNGVAMGRAAISSGLYSVAIGNQASTNAMNGVSIGQGTLVNKFSSVSLGSFNVGLTTSIFELGYGTNDAARKNAITIDTSANMELDGRLGVAGLVRSYGSLYKSGYSEIPVTAETGDRWQGISGTQFVILARTGGNWVVKSSLDL